MNTMKAVYFDEFGDSSKLKIGEVPLHDLVPGEVRVKIAYTSVNPVDWKIRDGHLQELLPHELPIVSGWDAAGEVESVASDVTDWKVGDRVMAYTRLAKVHDGTYAEYINLPADYLAAVPKSLALENAAAIPLVGLTAYQALHSVVNLKAGEKVLITGGAGGVGSLAIQFAKIHGAEVTSTARPVNHGYLKELGATHTIDYTAADCVQQLKNVAPEGFPVIFDGAGGSSFEQTWQVAGKNARMVSIVEPPDSAAAGRPDVHASFHFVEPNGQQLKEIAELLDSKKVQLPQIVVRSVKEAAAAQDENKERRVRGKVVLKIDL